jgi:hypothetical protein
MAFPISPSLTRHFAWGESSGRGLSRATMARSINSTLTCDASISMIAIGDGIALAVLDMVGKVVPLEDSE